MLYCARSCYLKWQSPSEGHHSAIRPRAFSLGLLAPRCLGTALLLASIACGLSGSGAVSDWGEEGILSPARSPPRIAGLVFIVASTCRGNTNSTARMNGPSESAHRTTPLLVSIPCVRGVASASNTSEFQDSGGAHPKAFALFDELLKAEDAFYRSREIESTPEDKGFSAGIFVKPRLRG